MQAGIDSGGTFTDFVFWDGRRYWTRKVASTPQDPVKAILEGLGGLRPDETVHGSTVATNALLERRGARTAFVATAGFEDLLDLGRQNRRELYNLSAAAPQPIVERELLFGVPERVLYDGTAEKPLAEGFVRELAGKLREKKVESVAVCLLHAYANPVHEKQLAAGLGGLFVSLSHEVLPEYREFERAATTAVNAYVTPLMARYITRLEEQLAGGRLRIFQSNGGSIAASAAAKGAVQTVLSGPAGGVIGAAAVGRAAGFERIISFDMGGTSTDVSLYDGRLRFTAESEIGAFPIRVPMLDIHTVGAGGGSIARLDAAGALRVGPRSAGADPGPVCYGRGEEITVTDANLALGRIDPEKFLGGAMRLDVDRALSCLQNFAARAGVSREELARAIVEVANSNMERAIRAISVERGHDPRDFALLSFGGAGAQHACELAARLEISTVVVPPHAGVLSALGMLAADCVRDYSQSVLGANPAAALAALERQARAEMAPEGFDEVVCERIADLRYEGQSYEISVPWERREQFHSLHRERYGYHHPGRAVEAVTARVRAIGVREKIGLAAPSDRQTYFSVHVPPGWREREDRFGNLILTRS